MYNKSDNQSVQRYLLLFVLFLVCTGCASEIEDVLSQRSALSFNLQLSPLQPSSLQLSSVQLSSVEQTPVETQKGGMDNLSVVYLLTKKDGTFIHEIQSDYHKESGKIVMEPLPMGDYQMYVLAYNEQLHQSGLRINTAIASIEDKWFFFENDEIPLLFDGALYHTSYAFRVSKETEETFEVQLAPVLSFVDVQKVVPSPYLQNSMRDIRLSIDKKYKFYSEFTVDGTLQGEATYKGEQSIGPHTNCFFMPQTGSEPVTMDFTIETVNHRNDAYTMTETTQLALNTGMRVAVNLDLSNHPDSKNGMLYISRAFYDEENPGLILQDDEPKSIFYNEAERSFYINQPLQLSITENNELMSRFYSPVPIQNVSVWSSDKIYGERVLLAYYDSIPAFCDARFSFSNQMPAQEFTMESNSRIQLTPAEVRALVTSGLELECNDPFMEKIKQIQAKWYIRFNSFGGDPDAWNGAPVGNWMGIRPVHIRESIAIWLNAAYMFTLPDFEETLMSYQGQLYGNGGPGDIIDVSTIIPAITKHSGFNIGLVYTGNGVDGLGGGRTWGVAQHVFVNHYVSTYAGTVIFHELGHCIGYSHNSSMTYGIWASGIANIFYANNIASFPVSSRDYLNTNTNPNIY